MKICPILGIIYLIHAGLSPALAAGQETLAENDLARVSGRVEALDTQVATLDWQFKVFAVGGSGALFLLGFFGFTYLRQRIRSAVDSRLDKEISRAVKEELPALLEQFSSRAEEHLLRFARLLALRSSRHFDEALEEFNWDGRVSRLREQSPAVRRAVIDCLWGGRMNREQNRPHAWEAVTELVQDDATPESLALFLRLAISHRRYQDGINLIERHRNTILQHSDTALRAATLFRANGNLTEAIEISRTHAKSDDLRALVTINSIRRDLGNFDEVHDALRPAVERLVQSPSTTPPEGWHRLLNTYLANCLDRDRPDDAITAAEYIMRSAPGPVEVFTVGRLVFSLPEDQDKRSELLDSFRSAVPKLHPSDEAALRCQVLLYRIQKNVPAAIALLKDAIARTDDSNDPKSQLDAYFHRSSLGEIHIDQLDFSSAIDILVPASQFSFGGEAKFNLALAYAGASELDDSARWLREALREAPKWAARARDHPIFARSPEIAGVLADFANAASGEAEREA